MDRKQSWATRLSAAALLIGVCAATNAQAETIKFGRAPWPGVTVKTTVASQLLKAIGYQTHITQASWTIDLQGVARGDIDADLGIWMPTQKSTVHPLVKSGKVNLLVNNVPDAKYDLVVPNYVWKAGVHSIADLNKHAAKFNHRVYGIEAGNDGNEIVKKAIKNNTYNLGKWSLRPSSTAVMLTEVGKKIKKHKWVVFLGWKPHWMNIKYNIRYLKDPKKIWGGNSSVYTAINPKFQKNNPNVALFLKQMVPYSNTQSHWIYKFGFKNEPAKKVADDWIPGTKERVFPRG